MQLKEIKQNKHFLKNSVFVISILVTILAVIFLSPNLLASQSRAEIHFEKLQYDDYECSELRDQCPLSICYSQKYERGPLLFLQQLSYTLDFRYPKSSILGIGGSTVSFSSQGYNPTAFELPSKYQEGDMLPIYLLYERIRSEDQIVTSCREHAEELELYKKEIAFTKEILKDIRSHHYFKMGATFEEHPTYQHYFIFRETPGSWRLLDLTTKDEATKTALKVAHRQNTLNVNPVGLERLVKTLNTLSSEIKKLRYDFYGNHCSARSHILANLLADHGIETKKVWIVGDISKIIGGARYLWSFHTAPVAAVELDNGKLVDVVIDPLVSEEPIPVNDWLGSLDIKGRNRIEYSVFPPLVPCVGCSLLNRPILTFTHRSIESLGQKATQDPEELVRRSTSALEELGLTNHP